MNIKKAAAQAVDVFGKQVDKETLSWPAFFVSYVTSESGFGSTIFRMPALTAEHLREAHEELRKLRGVDTAILNIVRLEAKRASTVPDTVRRSIEQLVMDAVREKCSDPLTISIVQDWLVTLREES